MPVFFISCPGDSRWRQNRPAVFNQQFEFVRLKVYFPGNRFAGSIWEKG